MMNLINKIYDKVKRYIKNNYKEIIFLIIFAFFCFYDTDYIIYKPGGTINASNRVEGNSLYKSKGSFNMAYVGMMDARLPIYLYSKLKNDWELVKKSSVVYSEKEDINDTLQRDRIYYEEALSNATYVAFLRSGKDYKIKKEHYYVGVITDNNSSDLKIGDEILSFDGISITSNEDFIEYINDKKEADVIKIKYLRNGKEHTTNSKIYKENNRLYLGMSLIKILDIKSDYDIKIKSKSSESGPSGGLITALSIYDALTKKDITKGKKIVGTGTISLDGKVGEIGGVHYKLSAAVKDKADVFLCPKSNLKETLEYAKKNKYKIKIIGVDTFDEALDELKEINW